MPLSSPRAFSALATMAAALLLCASSLPHAHAVALSPWCAAKSLECKAACGSSKVDFHCRDKHGARSVSCSCTDTGVKFGHSEREGDAAPPSWLWPSWTGVARPVTSVTAPTGLLAAGEPVLLDDAPLRLGLALSAAGICLGALAAGAALALLALRAWRALAASRRSRPSGAAYKPAAVVATHGLDLEAADHPDAVALPHGKA